MKRRDLLKGLSFLPLGINALCRTPKEEPKPEPVKPPGPEQSITVKLPPQGAVSAWSETLTVNGWKTDLPDMAPGQDGWIIGGKFISGK